MKELSTISQTLPTRAASTGREHSTPAASGFDIEAVFRYALEKGAGVESMNTLMSMRRELKAEAAKEAYDFAMTALQGELQPIKKTKSVSTNSNTKAYSYAPLEHVIAEVKPLLQKHGFSFAFDTDVSSAVGWVIAHCDVTHSGGHRERKTAKFPQGAGTQIMSATQVYAAALTFATRRVFQNAFGIVCEGEDLDGRTTAPKPAASALHDKAPTATDAQLKKALVDLLRAELRLAPGYALDDVARESVTGWLVDALIIAPEETLGGLSGQRLAQVVAKVKAKQGGRP